MDTLGPEHARELATAFLKLTIDDQLRVIQYVARLRSGSDNTDG